MKFTILTIFLALIIYLSSSCSQEVKALDIIWENNTSQTIRIKYSGIDEVNKGESILLGPRTAKSEAATCLKYPERFTACISIAHEDGTNEKYHEVKVIENKSNMITNKIKIIVNDINIIVYGYCK